MSLNDIIIYNYENLGKTNRERNKKRKTYSLFLDFIDNKPNKSYNIVFKNAELLKHLTFTFPDSDIMMKTRFMEYKYCEKQYIKSKFNGGLIMRKFGYKGSDIDIVLNSFKEHIGYDYFNEYVLKTDKEKILEEFSNFINK